MKIWKQSHRNLHTSTCCRYTFRIRCRNGLTLVCGPFWKIVSLFQEKRVKVLRGFFVNIVFFFYNKYSIKDYKLCHLEIFFLFAILAADVKDEILLINIQIHNQDKAFRCKLLILFNNSINSWYLSSRSHFHIRSMIIPTL